MMTFSHKQPQEGLKLVRWLMTLSSLFPLFILWAIRGMPEIIPDILFIPICLLVAFLPTLCIYERIKIARRNEDIYDFPIGLVEDYRNHVLTYLFSTLLPFYRETLETLRDLLSVLVALIFIIILFFHLNLYYLNILFVLFGYQVFMVWPPMDNNPYTGREPRILITRRRYLTPGDNLEGYRLSNTIYLEVEE